MKVFVKLPKILCALSVIFILGMFSSFANARVYGRHPGAAGSNYYYGKLVTVGCLEGTTCYAQPVMAAPSTCAAGIFAMNSATTGGKGMYATALAAKHMGTEVRFDFERRADGMCWATLVGGF